MKTSHRAYSLIEVLIAGAILVIGITGAALMANALLVQEQSNGFSLRAFNAQEQAARLWQLGLSPSTITNILPERCSSSTNPPAYSVYFNFNSSTTNISGASVEILNPLIMIFHSATRGDGSLVYRTNTNIVVRPTIR